MRSATTAGMLACVIAVGSLLGGIATPSRGIATGSDAVQAVPSAVVLADDLPHTRMTAMATGPLEFRFFVRPKLPSGENWKVVLKAKECGSGKKWVTVYRGTTRTRQEWVRPGGMKTIRALMKDDGRFSGVRAYRLITPEQRGYARTVKTFRNYPLDNIGFIRIGVC